MKHRNKAWKKCQRYQSTNNYNEYKKIRTKVVDMMRADEDAYRKKLIKGFKDQPKGFYGYMRQLHTVKDSVTALKNLMAN